MKPFNLSNLKFTAKLVADIRNAAYISAFITFLFLLIEVPILILYIMMRYILTFLFSLIGLALCYLITMLWNKLITTTEGEPEEA